MDIDTTSALIYKSLLGLSDQSGQDGLLSNFDSISVILDKNAEERRTKSKTALVAAEELSATQKLVEAAEKLSEAVDRAKDAVLDHLEKEFETTYTTVIGQMAGSTYGAIWTAYVISRLARTAAISAMDAKVSEGRAAYSSRMATKALKPTAENSVADAKEAASVARSAAKQASNLAVQAAASVLDLLKKLRDSGPSGIVEDINKGIKELEAIEAITGATITVVGGMVLETEGVAAKAEEAARSAAEAAEAADTAAGTAETAEEAAEEAQKAGPAKEKIVKEFLEELDTLKHTNDFLNQSLGDGPSLREKLPEATRNSLSALDFFQKRKLAEFSRNNGDKLPEELLAGSLDIMRKIGQSRTDLTREHLLKLNDFTKLDQLDKFLESPASAEHGFLRNDLELRRENLKKGKEVFEKSKECLFCAAPGESVFASGETDSTKDLFLTVKCIFNNQYMKAVVDTGATCNIVSDAWINKNKHDFLPTFLRQNAMNKGAPDTLWKDVEFVVLDGHQGDALLGLPFLKLTQIIHSSTGQLLFAEYEEVVRKEGAPRPIYNHNKARPPPPNL
ncbi:hypothetical protein BDD12DRAFT_884061 [Trichophaea hybrida]|nr:hypothetical protein BDD12DRAFT_884061 [Trichophaea hybrida]